MEQNWAEFKGLFTDILANKKFSNSLLTKKFLKLKEQFGISGTVRGRTFGHCYVMSETAYYMLGGKEEGWKPMFIKHLGCPHWFLKHTSGFILDLSEEQFSAPPDHDRAVGKGFMTKLPSKRSKILMKKILSNARFIIKNNVSAEELDDRLEDLIMKENQAAPKIMEKLGMLDSLDEPVSDWYRRFYGSMDFTY